MLEPAYQNGSPQSENFENCDTTTSNAHSLATPFSVKDILNLNMGTEGDFACANINFSNLSSVKSEYNNYEEYISNVYSQQNWDNSFAYDHYGNYNFYGTSEANVKSETGAYGGKGFFCENSYSSPSHVQQLSNLCVPFQERKEGDFSGLDSPSEYCLIVFWVAEVALSAFVIDINLFWRFNHRFLLWSNSPTRVNSIFNN